MSIIYYGAEKTPAYMVSKLREWMTKTGEPKAFVFREETLRKFKTPIYLNRYPVISIEDAMKAYPDCEVYVVYQNENIAKSEAMRLLAKVPGNKIHFLEADLEFRKNCSQMGKSLFYRNGNIPICTVGNRNVPGFKVNADASNIDKILDEWSALTTKLAKENQVDAKNKCLGCPQMKYGFYKKTPKVENLFFMQNLRYDSCNLRCQYCFSITTDRWSELKTIDGPSTYEVIKNLSEHPDFKDRGNDFTVTFANGEICVNKYFKDIMNVLLNVKWNIEIISNMSVYREELAELMKTGRVKKVITSLDCGTRETFKKLKINDRFNQTVENLHKYDFSKTTLIVKYVFLEGYNDNEADIDAFYDIVKSVGGIVMISADNKTNKKPYTDKENLKELTERLISHAVKGSSHVIADVNNLNVADVTYINKTVKNLKTKK